MNRFFRYFFILLIVPVCSAQGQVNFRDGRIITSQNDTIHGLIKDGINPRNTKVCLFKEDKKSEVVRYYPEDLKSYRVMGGKYYATRVLFYEGRWNPVFTDVLLEGNIDLFFFRKDKNASYYMELEDGRFMGLINRDKEVELTSNWRHSVYTDYEAVKVPVYRDTLHSLFRNSEQVLSRIDNVKYNHQSLIHITKAYIDETCAGDDCITYERDLNKTRDRFGIYSGAHFSKFYFSGTEGESYLETAIPLGIFYAIPLTFIHDRLFFQAELAYRRLKYNSFRYVPSGTEYDRMRWDVIGIPILFHYRISSGKFSPTFGAGKEFGFVANSDVVVTKYEPIDGLVTSNVFIQRTQMGGWVVDLGADYALSSNLSIFSKIRVEWYRNKVITNKNENNFTFNNAIGTLLDSYTAAIHLGVRF